MAEKKVLSVAINELAELQKLQKQSIKVVLLTSSCIPSSRRILRLKKKSTPSTPRFCRSSKKKRPRTSLLAQSMRLHRLVFSLKKRHWKDLGVLLEV